MRVGKADDGACQRDRRVPTANRHPVRTALFPHFVGLGNVRCAAAASRRRSIARAVDSR